LNLNNDTGFFGVQKRKPVEDNYSITNFEALHRDRRRPFEWVRVPSNKI